MSVIPNVWGKALAWICYGEGLLLAGNIDAARNTLRQGCDLSIQINSIPYQACAQFGLAKVALVEGNAAAAQEYANQSRQNFTQIGDIHAQEVSQWIRDQLATVASSE